MVFHRILCVPLVEENREVRTTKYRCIFQIECDVTVCGDQRKRNEYDDDEVDDEELFAY